MAASIENISLPLTRMIRKERFASVGRCIYCGEPANSDEHIIAFALGGELVLPAASCGDCAKITSAVEEHCITRLAGPLRRQFGFRSRHKKRPKRPQTVTVNGVETAVPDIDFPGMMVSLNFPAPAILGLSQPAAVEISGGSWEFRCHCMKLSCL